MDNKKDIRVAQILEFDKIVINKGENDGISNYMEFLVFDEGEEIFDPITKRSLGILENPKGSFKIVHIQQNMTVLISKLNRPSKLLGLTSNSVDPEHLLLNNIRIGDRVKIINW